MSRVEERLRSAGLELPETPAPVAAYVAAVTVDRFVFTAGQVPRIGGELVAPGKVGSGVTKEEARDAAKRAAVQAIAAIKSVVADLDRVDQVAKVTVFVHSAPGFSEQPFVADG